MADETLVVVPAGLLEASKLIGEQAAALSLSCGQSIAPAERSGAAAARLYRAFDVYREGLSRRLLAVSDELTQIAGRYLGADADSGTVVNGVAPVRRPGR